MEVPIPVIIGVITALGSLVGYIVNDAVKGPLSVRNEEKINNHAVRLSELTRDSRTLHEWMHKMDDKIAQTNASIGVVNNEVKNVRQLLETLIKRTKE